jgi:hypothetical protein
VIPVDLGWPGFSLAVLLGAAAGIVSLFAFRRYSDLNAFSRDGNRIVAHLLEFRLFADHPRAIWDAQLRLIWSVVAILRHVFLPSLVVLVPVAILFALAEGYCAHAALAVGQPAVVTAEFRDSNFSASVQVLAPAGVQVESPMVRSKLNHQASWRIRPVSAVDGKLQLSMGPQSVAKSLCANRGGLHWISEKRTGVLSALFHPGEMPFQSSSLEAIAVTYPDATIFGHSWIFWFWLGSILGAVTLTKSIYRRPLA